MGVSLIAVGI